MSGRVTYAKLNTMNLDLDPSVVVGVDFDGLAEIAYGTRAQWEALPEFVPDRGQIVVWSDHAKVVNPDGSETPVPGFKIGDGAAYNIDLPFVGDDIAAPIMELLREHIENSVVHVTDDERNRWNRKITTSDEVHGENLVLSRN